MRKWYGIVFVCAWSYHVFFFFFLVPLLPHYFQQGCVENDFIWQDSSIKIAFTTSSSLYKHDEFHCALTATEWQTFHCQHTVKKRLLIFPNDQWHASSFDRSRSDGQNVGVYFSFIMKYLRGILIVTYRIASIYAVKEKNSQKQRIKEKLWLAHVAKFIKESGKYLLRELNVCIKLEILKFIWCAARKRVWRALGEKELGALCIHRSVCIGVQMGKNIFHSIRSDFSGGMFELVTMWTGEENVFKGHCTFSQLFHDLTFCIHFTMAMENTATHFESLPSLICLDKINKCIKT